MEIALLIILLLVLLFYSYKILSFIVNVFIYIILFPFILSARILKYIFLSIWSNSRSIKKQTRCATTDSEDYIIVRVKSVGFEYFIEYLRFLKRHYISLNLSHSKEPDKLINNYIKRRTRSCDLDVSLLRKIHSDYKSCNQIEQIDYNVLGKSFVNLNTLFYLRNLYESRIDFNIFESVAIKSFSPKLEQKINDVENVVIKADRKALEISSVYAILFKSKKAFINLFLCPTLGYVGNYSENKYYLFLSIGAARNELLKKNSSMIDSYGIVHKLNFTVLKLNIGYDQSSYIIYLFGGKYNINYGDSLIFSGGGKEIYLQLDIENIYFDGDFRFEFDEANLNSQIHEHHTTLNEKKYFAFSIVRVSAEKIYEIGEIQNLIIYLYKPTHDNYYRLEGNDSWCDKLSNEKLFQYLIKALPSIPEFEIKEELENEIKNKEEIKLDKTNTVYVYLMKDNHTEFYKIGISNDPKYREKTLLSQKPSIELIYKREFVDRELSLVMEKTLHNYFHHKRVRGEWFDLDEEDLIKFKSVLGLD